MKKALLTVLLSLTACVGFSQGQLDYFMKPKRISLYGGAGLATSNNYDVGVSGGLDAHFWLQNTTFLGAMVFLQGHSLYYDHEAFNAKHGLGTAGEIFRHESKYVFVCPKVAKLLWIRTNFMPWVYVYGGAGFKMSGYDSVQKWDHAFEKTNPGYYDSTIDASKNLQSMVLRVGFGFAQDIYWRGNFWISFKEDIGFLPTALTTSGQVNSGSPSHTEFSVNKINPTYISLQIGITYIKGKKTHNSKIK